MRSERIQARGVWASTIGNLQVAGAERNELQRAGIQPAQRAAGFNRIMKIFQRAHRQWVEQALEGELGVRDEPWSEAIAVGNVAFVGEDQKRACVKAMHRDVV